MANEMKLRQPARTSPFTVGLVTQMLFLCKDDYKGCVTGEWSVGAINRLSNGKEPSK